MRGLCDRPGRRCPSGPLAVLVAGALGIVACGGEESSTSKRPERLVPEGTKLSRLDLSVTGRTAGRFRYAAPKTARGGLVEIRFRNDAAVPRKAQLWRVGRGHTVEEALRVGERLPPWLVWAGGVGLVQPKATGVAVQRLAAGIYYVTGNRDERRGVAPLRVSAPDGEARLRGASARITALDYGYDVSRLKAGSATVEFRNAGKEPHHAFFAPLRAGRTVAEASRFFAGKLTGPPPVDTEGTRESVVLEGGERQVTRLGLKSGRYALLCVVRDRAGGPPHIDKGMLEEVEVP